MNRELEVITRGKKMKTRRIWGIVCIIVGAVMLFFSHYISKQVAEGKIQIRQGKQAIKSTKSVFGISKYTKPIGQTLTSSGRKKLAAGEQDIAKFTEMSRNLKMSGIVLIIVGLGLIFIGKRKK